jgi:hypothetical protein
MSAFAQLLPGCNQSRCPLASFWEVAPFSPGAQPFLAVRWSAAALLPLCRHFTNPRSSSGSAAPASMKRTEWPRGCDQGNELALLRVAASARHQVRRAQGRTSFHFADRRSRFFCTNVLCVTAMYGHTLTISFENHCTPLRTILRSGLETSHNGQGRTREVDQLRPAKAI